jgi:putative PIN family toxin of toxin-antitoxin system
MHVLLDTNIWISGLLWGGNPGKVLQLARTQQITVYVSLAQFDELSRTLKKPKLQPRLQKLSTTADAVMQAIRELSQPIADAPVEVAIANLRDPNDAFLLNVAIAANVECLVSGDDDLISLATSFPVPILTAAEFLARFFPN